MAATAYSPVHQFKKAMDRPTLAYSALVVFTILYYTRPGDFIAPLALLPLSKISGGIALIGLLVSLGAKDKPKLPMPVKVLILLLGQMILASLFGVWIKGALIDTTFDKFSKGVIVAILISMIVVSVQQLRTLFFIQAASVSAVAFASVVLNHGKFDRLYGIQQGILNNPNDLAINIAINFPLCVAFLLMTRGIFKKTLWGIGLVVMLYAVYATYSRSGLVAMVMSGLVCFWAYGIKGKRKGILLGTALLGVATLCVVAGSTTYRARVESLFAGNIADSGDKGSLEKRSALLKESLRQAAMHPLFGVGPGNFPQFTEGWQVAHNTYTEFAAEAGIPALSLFLLALTGSFRNIRNLRKSPGYQKDITVRLYTDALWASLAAYVAGAAFSSTEYNLFPYFVIGYTCALYRLGQSPSFGTVEAEVKKDNGTRFQQPKTVPDKLAWTRS
jgi:O-antigen ligase